MNLFDVIGPIMISPSVHTPPALFVWVAWLWHFWSEPVIRPTSACMVPLPGTGRDMEQTGRWWQASWAGTRTMPASPFAESAREAGLVFRFETVCLGDEVHPNTVVFALKGKRRRTEDYWMFGRWGRIKIAELNGFPLELTGEFAALITLHHDLPASSTALQAFLPPVQSTSRKCPGYPDAKGELLPRWLLM